MERDRRISLWHYSRFHWANPALNIHELVTFQGRFGNENYPFKHLNNCCHQDLIVRMKFRASSFRTTCCSINSIEVNYYWPSKAFMNKIRK
ncbi:hypothetical protein chiPu_0014799 [Chiloscyllium punctatum]|uniref:Uncharacterized protein n=1 Tax=Chiloscyllium punctatum TaxID=137246 RepID=A0A401T0X7_CHIPU|nr:hypothetical protein [Chiloscyllium punctatum]